MLKKSKSKRKRSTKITKIDSSKRLTFIYPPTIEWDYKCFQRPHQLFRAFARQGHKAYFVDRNPFSDQPLQEIVELEPNLFIVPESHIDQIPKANKNVVLYNTHPPTINEYRNTFGNSLVWFDYMDESVDEFSPYAAQNEMAMKEADIVVTTSERLFLIAKSKNKNSVLARNGADIEHFANVPTIPDSVREVLPKDKPIVGFFGAIQSWIDFDLIEEIAKKRPEYNFVLIGPDYIGTSSERFKPYSNIHLLGYIPYRDLNQYTPFFHVGFIPFQVREMTKSSNPIKMYEYLAAGLPVVSTDLPEVRVYSDVTYTASNIDELAILLDKAVRERFDTNLIEKRKEVARLNSWDARAKTIIDFIYGGSTHEKTKINRNDARKKRG